MGLKEKLTELKQYAQGMNVLYVEDETQIRENTAMLLSNIFSGVTTANNGAEGLRAYQEGRFDLVITDILMPEMNGVVMIQKIKEIDDGQNFIVTSACEDSHFLLELINLGIAQFILKPMKTEMMIDTFSKVARNLYNARKVEELTLHLRQDLVHQSTLLEQYKEIVDIAMIVAKTNLQGEIIYVNNAFSALSGYSQEEMVQKGHQLIRHADVPATFYSDLWKTILDKKTWHGRIKNRKKDGSYYITDTTIKPILDEFGHIIEFISIGYDITRLHDLNEEIWNTQQEMLNLLGEIGETRSNETGNHVKRVSHYSRLLAELYGLGEEEIRLVYSASPMHDIGKIGIPDSILLKPAKLEPDEYEIMKTHSAIGHDILKSSNRPLLKAAAIIAHEHHEKFDGSGYPRGLKGDQIHIYGRITALADVFDALSCERVYKKAWPMEKIIELVVNERGRHFDPDLVDIFMENLDRFIDITQRFTD
ncbi:MAG: HD domain-containing phosphohydrolase [Sulfuricurvum sp.]